jgi:trehalose/maltose transport system substrate-binding protein
MSLKRAAARIFLWTALAALLVYSIRGPESGAEPGLSVLMEPDGTGVWRDLVAQFNRSYPGAPIRLIEGPPATDTREDLYSTSFLSGDSAYDIVYSDSIWVAKFAAAGWLMDLSTRPSAEDRADFLPVEFAAGSYQGKLYRMPAFTDAGVLFYRKDLVQTPPQTFAELLSLARAWQTPERWGFLWQGKQYEGLVTVFLEVLWGYGGDWIDAGTREVRIDSPEAVQAIEFLKNTVGTVSPPAATTYAEEDTRNIFQNGRAVFMRNWPYVWTLIQQSGGEMKDKVAMAPMVHAPGRSSAATLGGWGFAISRYSKNPERAWQFVDFLTRPEQLLQVQQRQGRIPSRRSMIPPEFLPILASARMRPAIPEYAQASDILQRWLSSALTGRVSPPQAVREIAKETRALLAGGQQ